MSKLWKKMKILFSKSSKSRTTSKLINWLYFFWLTSVLFLYFNNSEYFFVLIALVIISIPLVFILGINFGFRTPVTTEIFFGLVKKIIPKNEIKIKFPDLLAIIFLSMLAVANLILFFVLAIHDFNALGPLIDIYNILKLKSIQQLTLLLIASLLFFYFSNKYKLINKLRLAYIFIILFLIFILLLLLPSSLLNVPDFISDNFIYNELLLIKHISLNFFFLLTLVLSAYFLGKNILKKLKFNFQSKLEYFLFAFAIGLIPLFFGVYALLMIGIFYTWSVMLLVLLLFVSMGKVPITENKILSNFDLTINFNNSQSFFRNFLILILCFVLLVNYLSVFKPSPTDFDSLSAYYNNPYSFVQNHVYHTTNYKTGNMSQNTEMLYAFIIITFGPQFISHIPFLFFLLCLLGFYALIRNTFGRNHALLVLFTITFVPWNFMFLNLAKVEFILSYFLLLVILSSYYWYKNKYDHKFLYLIGVFAGACMGIKYNAALLLLPLFIGIFMVQIVRSRRYGLSSLLRFLLMVTISLIIFSPWMIKNKIYFNNYFYPYQIGKQMEAETVNGEDVNFIKHRYNEVQKLKTSRPQQKEFLLIGLIKTIWSKTIKLHFTEIHLDFGIAPLVLFPFAFFFLNKRWFAVGVSLVISYFVLWYLIGLHQSWYAFFGFTLISSLIPYLLLKDKKLLYIYSIFIVVILVQCAFMIQANNFLYLGGFINSDEYLSREVDHYKISKIINKMEIKGKIYIPADPRTVFINNNNSLVISDLFYTQFGSWYYNGGIEGVIKNIKIKNISYILLNKTRDDNHLNWLSSNGLTIDEYLKNYDGEVLSMFQDEKNLNDFLNTYCRLIADDEYISFYEVHIN